MEYDGVKFTEEVPLTRDVTGGELEKKPTGFAGWLVTHGIAKNENLVRKILAALAFVFLIASLIPPIYLFVIKKINRHAVTSKTVLPVIPTKPADLSR